MTLDKLNPGQSAVIRSVGGEGALRRHFLDMGVIPGAEITLVKFAPMGDPIEFALHGYALTLRASDAAQIDAVPVKARAQATPEQAQRPSAGHPGPGGAGKPHTRAGKNPLPPGTQLTFALVGNQNCGKTTLFNQLTGMNQRAGNFPGVTVDRKDGVIRGHANTLVTDLPGVYSMSPYSGEEVVTRSFLLHNKPCAVINIVDATSLTRSLYLTLQLMELNMPMVLAVNMMDELTANGGSIRVSEMEAMLGIPVAPISAAKNEGVDELVDRALHIAQDQERPDRLDFCDAGDCGSAVHRCLHGVMRLIEGHAREADVPVRFAASKLAEGDPLMPEQLRLSQNEKEAAEHIIQQMEKERGLDRAAAIADMRYSFIRRVCDSTVVRPRESREHARSQNIDRILTGRRTAIPAFIAIMSLVFCLTFNVAGAALSEWLEAVVGLMTGAAAALLSAAGVSPVLESLVVDGVFGGVGSVVSFLPFIVVLFFFLSLLEDSSYMARVAFVMDKPLRKIGLSGRSIVPLLAGFGCTVPGVMATRTLPSERDRKMTILLTPFMSCTAKLPIYAFFSAVFFPNDVGVVMAALYALGVIAGILTALALRRTTFTGQPVPFVMELPNYRLPGPKNVARLLWDKAKDFLQRAFSVIFLATIAIWFLQTFNARLTVAASPQSSLLAKAAGLFAPLLRPLGFGDWRFAVALLAGFMAKESVVSTLILLFGSAGALRSALTPLSAAALLVFCLLYTPCAAAISAVRRELGSKWALGMAAFQCAVAYAAALVVRLLGLMLGFE